ncbi:hypothetical protein ACIBI4_15355 [Streptomyces sp. NPDC050418]|uniref:hypothetical protein n=1 Tax=Streptomyces sp. NPDC050418 TaxID=3365612 RepID=UPI0037987594
MRSPRWYGPLLAGLSLLLVLPGHAGTAPAAAQPAPEPRPFGADCRTGVDGSRVTAYCHNPYPETDHVRLHIECEQWWDIDTDAAPVATGPAQTVRLSGRCWKGVGSAWVSHARAPRG